MVAEPRILRPGERDVAVVKPSGMSVELPGRDEVSLIAWARRTLHAPEARLPHRLDRIARGIVLVALDAEAAAFHGRMIAEGRWEKHYLARVAPVASEPAALLGRHVVHLRTRGRRAEVVRSGGRRAELEVVALAPAPARRGELHLLVRLVTGRFHQIRATLAHLRAPISGDPIYDPQAGRRGAAPYLEHVLLRAPRLGAAEGAAAVESLHLGDDPERETLEPSLAERLARVVAG